MDLAGTLHAIYTGFNVAVVPADPVPAVVERRGVDVVADLLHLLLLLSNLFPVSDQEDVVFQHKIPAGIRRAFKNHLLSAKLVISWREKGIQRYI